MRLLLEGPSIEPLLARVQAEHGPTARIVHAERIRSGGVAGFFARERFEVTVEVDEPGSGAAPSPPARDRALPAHPEPRGLEALIAAAERAEQPAHRPLSTQSAAFAEVLRSLQAQTAEPAAAAPVREVQDHDEGASRHLGGMIDVREARDRDEGARAERRPGRAVRSFRDKVAAAGLPAALLDALPADAGPAELLDVLRTVPAAPRLLARAGYLVAVVGERREAMAAARRVADRLKLDPADVLFAGRAADDATHAVDVLDDVLTSTDQARRASAAARMGDVPAVVVVEAGYDRHELDWTVQMLHALSPDQVMACVDATRKTADTVAWLAAWRRPGVQVDALSVHRAGSTADPASVLALDVPVSELDGQDGAASTWLALLLERVTPQRTTHPRTTHRRTTPQRRRASKASPDTASTPSSSTTGARS